MNKKAIILSIILIFVLLVWAWSVYFFRDKIFHNNQSTITWTWSSVDELITKNYIPNFHHLDLRTKWLTSIPDLCKLVKWTKYEYDIWSIDLADNSLISIDNWFSCFKNLQELNLSFNKIAEIKNLNDLTFIKKLDLWNNEITEVKWLDKLKTLESLHLWYNKITDVNNLENLSNLTSLKIQHNNIDNISWLQKLYNLEELKMEFNNLDDEDLKNIKDLKKLKIITVWENKWINKETIDKLNNFTLKNMDTSNMQQVEKE